MKRGPEAAGEPKLPAPIDVKTGPLAHVTPEKLAEWRKVAEEFKRDPRKKTAFAIAFADLALVRLDAVLRETPSPKVLIDCLRMGERYVAFAFKEEKPS